MQGTVMVEGPSWDGTPARGEAVEAACHSLEVVFKEVPEDGRYWSGDGLISMDPETYVMTTGRLRAAPGVYVITHRGSGLVYIGSSIDMRRRWKEHRRDLRKGTHRSPHLQRSWAKYGEAYFTVRCIEVTAANKDVLREREQFWIDGFECTDSDFGYNTCTAAYSCFGVRSTLETRAKISLSKRGESNPSAMLTKEAVLAMRRLYENEMPCTKLAKLFGVAHSTAHLAVTGRTWEHLPDAIRKPKTVLTEEAVLAIRRLRADGMLYRELASFFEVSHNTAYWAAIGKTWKHVGDSSGTRGSGERLVCL